MKQNNSGAIGIFGGSFDPPHHGHLIVAEWAAVVLQLERVIFVPAGQHPFDKGQQASPAALRLQMVEAAVQEYPVFSTDQVELDREGPSFTVDTLEYFSQAYPGKKLYFLMGEDNLSELERWKNPQRIMELAILVVYNRAGRPAALKNWPQNRIILLDSPYIEISSSHIRHRIKSGLPVQSLVPTAVATIIRQAGLYI